MYQRAERVADATWDFVASWDLFAKDTVGKQLVRAADSIGANIAESAGRFHPNDAIRFLYYARGSLRETRYWLKRAKGREVLSVVAFDEQMIELDMLAKEINAYISFQRTRRTKETTVDYELANHPTTHEAGSSL